MTSTTLSYLFVVYAVGAIATGQLMFKKIADLIAGQSLGEIVQNYAAIAWFLLAMTIYMSATFFWIAALRNLPLNRSYMFMAMAFVIVPVLSKYFFAEELSRNFFLGAAIVAVGIYITQAAK